MPTPPLPSTHDPTTPSSTPNTHITLPAATAHGNALTTNIHHMVTHAKAKILKPLARMNFHATTTAPISHSHLHALRDPNWHKAMVDEYNGLISNKTWALVPRPANINIVRSMWLFKQKFNADGGSLSSEFALTDLGSLNYFLGIYAQRLKSGLFLSQSKFAEEILERAHMQHCNPCKTSVDTKSKLGSDGDPVSYPTLYRNLAGIANVVVETAWLQNLLLEIHAPLSTATLVYYDNVSAVYLSTNPVQH
nr:ribonuclease H-like domain-containing protein [Tanacetum cinerariifolium]